MAQKSKIFQINLHKKRDGRDCIYSGAEVVEARVKNGMKRCPDDCPRSNSTFAYWE